MAIVSTKNPSGLKLKLDCGKDDNGKSIFKTKTYSNVIPTSTDEAVYQVGTALASLCEYTLVEVFKMDSTSISE